MAKLTDHNDQPSSGTVGLPATSSGAQSARTRPHLPAYPGFHFYAHPERWKLGRNGVELDLAKLKLQPGINGATKLSKDAPLNISGAQQNFADAGYTPIPLGLDGSPYVAGHQTSTGAISYLERWQLPVPGSDVIRIDWDDAKAFAAAVRKHVGEPPIHVLEALRSEASKVLGRLQDKLPRKPSVARLIPGAEAALAAVEAEIEACRERLAKSDAIAEVEAVGKVPKK